MMPTSQNPIALRRLFRRALESNDKALIQEALTELKARLVIADAAEKRQLMTLLKLLVEKSVEEESLELLNVLLGMGLDPELLATACLKSGKAGWEEGYRALRVHTDRPMGITLTEAFILEANVAEMKPDTRPHKRLKQEIEELIAYARKNPGTMSSAHTFLKGLGYEAESSLAMEG